MTFKIGYGFQHVFKVKPFGLNTLVFAQMKSHDYSWFGVFLSKNCMHVKTVQIESFAIEIIISIYI
jgi:hypothetical protein